MPVKFIGQLANLLNNFRRIINATEKFTRVILKSKLSRSAEIQMSSEYAAAEYIMQGCTNYL